MMAINLFDLLENAPFYRGTDHDHSANCVPDDGEVVWCDTDDVNLLFFRCKQNGEELVLWDGDIYATGTIAKAISTAIDDLKAEVTSLEVFLLAMANGLQDEEME